MLQGVDLAGRAPWRNDAGRASRAQPTRVAGQGSVCKAQCAARSSVPCRHSKACAPSGRQPSPHRPACPASRNRPRRLRSAVARSPGGRAGRRTAHSRKRRTATAPWHRVRTLPARKVEHHRFDRAHLFDQRNRFVEMALRMEHVARVPDAFLGRRTGLGDPPGQRDGFGSLGLCHGAPASAHQQCRRSASTRAGRSLRSALPTSRTNMPPWMHTPM